MDKDFAKIKDKCMGISQEITSNPIDFTKNLAYKCQDYNFYFVNYL